jgi:fluoride exporter
MIAIFVGAGLGALLRWRLGLMLNSYFPSIPPGTLAANFSSELVGLLQQGRSLSACGAAALHLVGSVLMTFAGIGTVAAYRYGL